MSDFFVFYAPPLVLFLSVFGAFYLSKVITSSRRVKR